MYNSTTLDYQIAELEYIVLDSEPSEWLHMTIDDLQEVIDLYFEQALENLLKTEDDAACKSYPCYGYTTAQIIQDEDEYLAFWNTQITLELEESALERFEELLDWITN